ncbi:DUF4251 domain-containing protein [Mucilaginibacter sp. KACC 22063]|uniref:DUF4251 domain-containing protein n=1 Tax=Mucilaginibacter sp. KACC 22063 TaxID=3025666 RepID=UPI002365CC19|nr:DUF4251 domain-containing protein [Mucilaginibacter sp. KACC 22063]WDF53427.1 DUF4251 domain-containing protein [Mucilaginibacter sp. KACC 22063]
MKHLKYITCLVIMLLAFNFSFAQKKSTAKQDSVKNKVESKNFRFVAQYANPLRGGHPYLTSDYDIRVKPDSVISFLPYFGQAYFDVPYNPNEGGIKFTSTKFTYTKKQMKKGNWQITFIPKDVKNLQRVTFNIYPNGNTWTQFLFTNRDAISFDGYIDIKY